MYPSLTAIGAKFAEELQGSTPSAAAEVKTDATKVEDLVGASPSHIALVQHAHLKVGNLYLDLTGINYVIFVLLNHVMLLGQRVIIIS